MMQATDFADGDSLAELRRVDRPPVRRILGEGEVGPGAVVVLDVPGKDVSQVALAQDEDMVETLSADRADQAFREGICHGLRGAVRTSRLRILSLAETHPAARDAELAACLSSDRVANGALATRWRVERALTCRESRRGRRNTTRVEQPMGVMARR
jgi:hypothetical protein